MQSLHDVTRFIRADLCFLFRVVMKKKVHKKTVVRDGKEETIVTTDTHVEHEDRGPEDIQAAMKEIIDNFVEVRVIMIACLIV